MILTMTRKIYLSCFIGTSLLKYITKRGTITRREMVKMFGSVQMVCFLAVVAAV